MASLADQLLLEYTIATKAADRGLRGYLDYVVIDSRPEPSRFKNVARPWQWERVGRVEVALEAAVGVRPRYEGPRIFLEVMPRGFDKTSGLGRFANYALGFSKRPVEIVAGAADADQAGILLESMQHEARLNPWIGARLNFGRKRVYGQNGSVLKILTSDAFSSYGLRPDIIIADEITHWENEKLWLALASAFQKQAGMAVMFVITNAGLLGSWQHTLLQTLKSEPTMGVVTEASPDLGSWMLEEDIAAASRILPPGEVRRVIRNEWIDPAEDSGYITRAEVARVEANGQALGLAYRVKGEPGIEYTLVVDYGPKRDRTALAVMHQGPDGRVIVDRLDVWQGSPESPVQVSAVHDWIAEQWQKNFVNIRALVVDPYQLEGECQHFEQFLVVERFEARAGKANYEMAEALRSAIVNEQVVWYPGAGTLPGSSLKFEGSDTLENELAGLIIKRMPYGYKFDHEANRHDDRAVVIGMGLVSILNGPGPQKWENPPPLAQREEIVDPLKFWVPGMTVEKRERPHREERRGLWGN